MLKAGVLKLRTCRIVIVFILEADKLENTAKYFNSNVVVVIRTKLYVMRIEENKIKEGHEDQIIIPIWMSCLTIMIDNKGLFS